MNKEYYERQQRYDRLLEFLNSNFTQFWHNYGHLSLNEILDQYCNTQNKRTRGPIVGLIQAKIRKMSPYGILWWHCDKHTIMKSLESKPTVEELTDSILEDFWTYRSIMTFNGKVSIPMLPKELKEYSVTLEWDKLWSKTEETND